MSKRNYGIDLLRLVLMFMICILHSLGQGGLLDAYPSESLEYKILWLIEVFALCAVNAFAIISGYMANEKPTKYARLIELWFQVFFYSCLFTLILCVLGFADNYDSIKIVSMIFPVSSKQYWYFTAYFLAFFFFLVIKHFVFYLDERTARRLFTILFVILVWGGWNDVFQLNQGYSTIWLVSMYLLGVLAKKSNLFANKKSSVLILLYILSNLFSWILHVEKNYTLPTILLSGLLLVIIFSRIQISGKIISKLSPLAFGVYLFHLNFIIWDDLEGSVARLVSSNIIILIIQVIGIASLIFILGLATDFIRKKLFDFLHIHDLSVLLEEALNKIIDKCSEVMK